MHMLCIAPTKLKVNCGCNVGALLIAEKSIANAAASAGKIRQWFV